LAELSNDPAVLDRNGFWVVLVPHRGTPHFARFKSVRPARPWPGVAWQGPRRSDWVSTMSRRQFCDGVTAIREHIRAGDVYQVNLTRRLRAPVDSAAPGSDIAALGAALATGNPAPFSAVLRLPESGVAVASASPELFLKRRGNVIWSSPIKGTAATVDGFTAKDRAENVMIVDLVRNDLSRIARVGGVTTERLLAVESHPGLHHLVSTVRAELADGIGWPDILAAAFPPGSVTGAPKIAACQVIDTLEVDDRGPYCGALGWVDADRGEAELNVAIRTFWMAGDHLWFGTGGGITIDSTPEGEWAETELKARRLLEVASRPLE
jgi:para-aminobenzoate synthetase component 1